ncbi:hypothetical protein CAOG_04615 [Capsaspora owczarzaki ATCC 30864]|uniref:Pyridoxal phosphate phosphatase PHOSPHO2 n=1 Tax=Capsaspora owczarzaki (strain ATCC 30864) TaxID=595528 RepID=A0A0D2VS73_CAPO3|nr:hypothetical protein CAOG_04615 [Capsaspora owczarzaki ATCC 30864]KJE93897.1 hypothetical protein CAOG_004615 [Capsaspora owczarzaki ATCC 30864]|eukprot:XP_004347362.1 hypothetical protein CAOG_04615 [Capsaspora owczarzaki ATCC 30864]
MSAPNSAAGNSSTRETFLSVDLAKAVQHLADRGTTDRVLCVFDFDWTIVDTNSDEYVIEQLAPDLHSRFEETRLSTPLFRQSWLAYMNYLMGQLHELGFSAADISRSLKATPLSLEMQEVLRTLTASGKVDVVVLSDANEFFIRETLQHYNLLEHVSLIISNPFLHDPRFTILPFSPTRHSDHICTLCNDNMCKGTVLDYILDKTEYHRVVYIGDGGNDFCPSTRLCSSDVVMARDGFHLVRLLRKYIAAERQKAVSTHGAHLHRRRRAKHTSHPEGLRGQRLNADKFDVDAEVQVWCSHADLLALFRSLLLPQP